MAAELKDETGLELCPRISIVSPSRRSQDGGLCRQPRSKLLLQRLHKGGDTIVPYDFPQSSENGQSPRSPASFDFDKDDRLPSNHVSPRRNSAKFSPCARPSISSHRISFSNHSESHDRIDALPKEMTFTWIDVFAILFSIGSFLFDIGMDMIVASLHYRNGDYWYFTLTTTFIVIPTLIMTGISMRWYVLDSREEGSPPVSPLRWIFRIFFLLLQLGPILRYIDSLVYGFKFRKSQSKPEEQRRFFTYMVYEDTDATMLRLFECFMEAAPQLVLQLYILAVRWPHSPESFWLVFTQCFSVCTSLISLSWSLVSYHRALRMSLPNKINLTWQGMATMFLWRIHVIASRMMALALFASVYRHYIAIVCGVHWILMFLWIVSMRTSFCANRLEELGYNGVLGVMYIFCYFNPVDSPTRFRYLTFYIFSICENTLLLCLWYFRVNSSFALYPFRLHVLALHYVLFAMGLTFMCLYYLLFHPTRSIEVCRKLNYSQQSIDQQEARRVEGYKPQMNSGLWTTQGRVLHPRPAVPTPTLRTASSEANLVRSLIRIKSTSQPECASLATNSTVLFDDNISKL